MGTRKRVGSHRSLVVAIAIVSGIVLLSARPSLAQGDSAIAGQVTDTTGAVLPGVTVQASSPALIEGSRVTVTDGNGRYAITALSIGTYTVRFTLPGFTTAVREGIRLPASFTATIDSQLAVGSVEETVTVAGQSPLVDVQRTDRTDTVDREVIDTLPTGRSPWAMAVTLPGVTMTSAIGRQTSDVGGTAAGMQQQLMRHGSNTNDSYFELDGMNMSSPFGNGNWQLGYTDEGAIAEYVIESMGGTAESPTSGVVMNFIPKEGGNAFRTTGYASFSNESLYSDNFSKEHEEHGLKAPAIVDGVWDYNATVGGPIARDRLWFLASTRWWGSSELRGWTFNQPGVPATPEEDNYSSENKLWSGLLRLTTQLSRNNKFNISYSRSHRDRPFLERASGPDANVAFTKQATLQSHTPTPYVGQAKWTSTLSNRLLLETGYTINHNPWANDDQDDADSVTREDIVLLNQWSAGDGNQLWSVESQFVSSKLSYVTGSHNLKTGLTYRWGYQFNKTIDAGGVDLDQQYSNGAARFVQVYSTPILETWNEVDKDIGVFVQDSWTRNRLTLNGGLRFDYFRGRVPAQSAPAGRFVPARVTPAIDDLPTFSTLSPRVGVAYDLRGDGRTAIKAAWGRYTAQEAAGWAGQFNRLALTSEVRTWIDGNGDDVAQDNEIGPPINPNFGLPSDPRNVDPDIKRPHNHSFNVNVDRELMPRVSLSGGYYYRIYRNDRITDDLNTRPEDWLSAPITNAQTGLTSTVFYLPIALRGQAVNSIIRNSDNWRNYHGFDLNMTGRFGDGGVVVTGIQLGRSLKYTCDQENLNGANHFLSAATSVGGPWCDQTQLPNDLPFDKTFKLSAIYPLPLKINVSGVFQSNPGVSRILTGTVPAVTLPTPGYFPGSAVAFVPFVPEGVEWTERINQVDLKFNGRIDAAKMRIDPELAIYNVFNADPVLYYNDIIGPTLGAYQKIMQGRLIRFGVRIAY